MDGRGVAAAMALGAQAVQLGTAFLGCVDAGTSAAHRQALGEETTLTRVLTGRLARAVRTPVVDKLEAANLEPPDYPLPRFFLSEAPMLAGQGGRLARRLPAGDLVKGAAIRDGRGPRQTHLTRSVTRSVTRCVTRRPDPTRAESRVGARRGPVIMIVIMKPLGHVAPSLPDLAMITASGASGIR